MKKYYAIKKGGKVGVFDNWDETKKYIDGFKGSIYKSFKTEKEAYNFLLYGNEKIDEIIKNENINLEEEKNIQYIRDVEKSEKIIEERQKIIKINKEFINTIIPKNQYIYEKYYIWLDYEIGDFDKPSFMIGNFEPSKNYLNFKNEFLQSCKKNITKILLASTLCALNYLIKDRFIQNNNNKNIKLNIVLIYKTKYVVNELLFLLKDWKKENKNEIKTYTQQRDQKFIKILYNLIKFYPIEIHPILIDSIDYIDNIDIFEKIEFIDNF